MEARTCLLVESTGFIHQTFVGLSARTLQSTAGSAQAGLWELWALLPPGWSCTLHGESRCTPTAAERGCRAGNLGNPVVSACPDHVKNALYLGISETAHQGGIFKS